MRLLTRRTVFLLCWASIGLAGGLAGWRGAGRWRLEAGRSLEAEARQCALAFDPETLRRLHGDPTDLATPAYIAAKTRLARVRQANPDFPSIRLLRRQPETGRIVLLADAEPPDARATASPGDEVPGARQSPALQETLLHRDAAAEQPEDEAAGAWVHGYAVIEPRAAAAGGTGAQDILALDLAAGRWQRGRWAAGLKSAGIVCLLLGLPFGGFVLLRHRAQQADLIRKLIQAVEQSRAAVVITGPDRRIEYVNAGFCAITGWRREEVVGQSVRMLASSETTEEQLQEIITTVQAGRTWRGETSNRRRDGATYPARCVAAPLHNATGRLTHIVAVIEDVTERRQAEATLVYAKERAEAGERAKGQFLAMMSHEIRTPLNGIIGFTDLLLGTALVPEQREYVQTIRNSGEALLQLASDVLDYSRIDAGRLSLEPQPCSVLEVLEAVLESFAAPAAEKQLELLHAVDGGVPPAVLVDAARLRQVLVNLVGNAIKFTAAGEIEVTVRAERRASGTAEVSSSRPEPAWLLHFAVRDTGIGIAPGERAKLFKPFSQIDSSSTRKYGGAGLGLAISRSLVQMMGGEISVTGGPGQGSTFAFSIAAGEAPLSARPLGLPDPDLLNGRTVAVVTAMPSLGRELARLAEQWGARPAAVPRDALAAEAWDVAVVDLAAADAEAWRRIFAQRPELSTRPIVALIPVDFPDAERGELRRHFRALIRKPVRHEALGMLVGASLQPVDPNAVSAGTMPATGLGLQVLLVEANPVGQRITQKMLENFGCHWDLAEDGRLAVSRLSRGSYDLVLLDLAVGGADALEVIGQIRRGDAGGDNRTIWITAVAGDAAEAQRVLTAAGGANDCLVQPFHPPELEQALRRSLTGRARPA